VLKCQPHSWQWNMLAGQTHLHECCFRTYY